MPIQINNLRGLQFEKIVHSFETIKAFNNKMINNE